LNQSEERKPISSLVSFASIGQNVIQIQSQCAVWYGFRDDFKYKNGLWKPA